MERGDGVEDLHTRRGLEWDGEEGSSRGRVSRLRILGDEVGGLGESDRRVE